MTTVNTFAPAPIALDILFSRGSGLPKSSHIAVVGAGAFGGWTALSLLRAGYKVTLLDAWGAGNARSSSGDETRVIRSTYGANEFYFNLNVRARELWIENQQRWNKHLFFNTGVLWFCYNEKNPLVDDSIPYAQKHQQPYQYLLPEEIRKHYPQINTTDLHHAWLDTFGGYLKARESTLAVWEAFQKEGGTYIQASVKHGAIISSSMQSLQLSTGDKLQADTYIFACGSWLGHLFPEVLGKEITCTKQEVYYFGTPSTNASHFDSMPAWIDLDGNDFYYGIPGNIHRGFKIGVDRRGEIFNPTDGERLYTPEVLTKARDFIAHRFPGLKNAPLLESRVCPYENSSDGNFIFQKHPEAQNTWLLGGGSGHGFKHGPALGELVSTYFLSGNV